MLYEEVLKLYDRFRLMHYKSVFNHIKEREGSLSATEAYSVDVIYLLGNPTIKQFSDYLGISQPNATYKINSLVEKGYIKRIPSDTDKREHNLQVSEKFHGYYDMQNQRLIDVAQQLESELPPDELKALASLLNKLCSAVE